METPGKESKKKVSFSDWLEILQQESWQLELLISGFALFGIWESRHILMRFSAYIGSHMPDEVGGMLFLLAGFYGLLKAAWSIFFINLLIHVVLRGLWIGAIGLRYVSGEIDYKTLGYNEIFEDYLERRVGRFDHYIEKLEKVCSVIFAYTFLLFFIFLSGVMVLVHLILLGELTGYLSDFGWDNLGIILIILYLILGFVVLIDFLTIGSIKKVRSDAFAKVYGFIYRFYSYTTLSFLYRPLLFNFFDYKYTRRLFWFSVPYVILVLFFLPGFYLENNAFYPSRDSIGKNYYAASPEIIKSNYYDDLRYQHYHSPDDIKRVTISELSLAESEISHSNGKLFFPFHKEDFNLLRYKYNLTPLNEYGFQHVFFDYVVEDTVLQYINKTEGAELLKLRRAERAARKSGELPKPKLSKSENGAAEGFSVGFKSGKYGDRERIPTNKYEASRDSVRKYWAAYRDDYVNGKILAIKNALLDANQIYIDDLPYKDQLTCKLFTHPNLGEKGIQCYFPTDSLPDGEHILRWERKTYNPHKLDSIQIIKRSIPFWIRSQR